MGAWSAVDAASRPTSYPGNVLDFSDLGSPDPLKRDLAYLRLLEELLGPAWVERWALERGKLEVLREWRRRGTP
jgi:hypothetical protein